MLYHRITQVGNLWPQIRCLLFLRRAFSYKQFGEDELNMSLPRFRLPPHELKTVVYGKSRTTAKLVCIYSKRWQSWRTYFSFISASGSGPCFNQRKRCEGVANLATVSALSIQVPTPSCMATHVWQRGAPGQ